LRHVGGSTKGLPATGDLAVVDLVKQKAVELGRWSASHILPEWARILDTVSHQLVNAKSRYQTVAQATKVPWPIIAVIHERESSQSWKASLAQGDPWNRPSIHVPAHRGPFKSWEDAAIDALVNCAPFAARWEDWSIGGALTLLEEYNGLGYFERGIPSPYIWSATDQYHRGKYIADGHFDPEAVDRQTGCAALLQRMTLIDPTIAQEWHP
jgi:lysozyme family protein